MVTKNIMGYSLGYLTADNPKEPYWVNTIHGNKHYRLLSLELGVSPDGLKVLVLYIGKHLFSVGKLKNAKN